MTPEREKEIREYKDQCSKAHNMKVELLAEIDRLRTPVVAITDSPIIQENITIDTRYKFEYEIRELKDKLAVAEPLLEERYLLLKFLEDEGLLFDAHEYISKIWGEK